MIPKLTPESFRHTIMDEAYRLRHFALRQYRTHDLDEKSAMWVIRSEAWDELRKWADFVGGLDYRANQLMGLPVRVTIYDSPDTPMIQLVMEPTLYQPPRSVSAQK